MRKQRKYREREREGEHFTTFIFYMLHASIATRKHKKDRVLQREERKNTPPKPGFLSKQHHKEEKKMVPKNGFLLYYKI